MQVIFPRDSGRLRVPVSAELMGRWRRGNAIRGAAGSGVSDGACSHHSGSESRSLVCFAGLFIEFFFPPVEANFLRAVAAAACDLH